MTHLNKSNTIPSQNDMFTDKSKEEVKQGQNQKAHQITENQ